MYIEKILFILACDRSLKCRCVYSTTRCKTHVFVFQYFFVMLLVFLIPVSAGILASIFRSQVSTYSQYIDHRYR